MCVCCNRTLIGLFQEKAVEFTTNKYSVMVRILTLALVYINLLRIASLNCYRSQAAPFLHNIFFSRSFSRSSVFSWSCFCSFTSILFSNLPVMHHTFSAVMQMKSSENLNDYTSFAVICKSNGIWRNTCH